MIVNRFANTLKSRDTMSMGLLRIACDRFEPSSRDTLDQKVAKARRIYARDVSHEDAWLAAAAACLCESKPLDCLTLLKYQSPRSDRVSLWNQMAAEAALELGDLESAVKHFTAALQSEPQLAHCWLALGEIHERKGQHRRAIAYFRRGRIFEGPDHACSLKLTRLLLRRKNVGGAIQVLHSSLLRDRRSPILNQELAMIFERKASRLRRRNQIQMVDEVLAGAAECYRIVAESQSLPEPYVALGVVEQKLRRFTASIRSFRKALELDATNPHALLHIASHDLDHGNIDESVKGFERVLSINPNFAEAHFRYSRSRKFSRDEKTDRYAAQLERLIGTAANRYDRMLLHFALAKVLDESGHFDRAWEHYDLANRHKLSHSKCVVQRKVKPQKPAKKLDVDDQIRFFTREYFSRCQYGSKSEMPIFIIGMPRSGTTLTEQILSSHPEISGAGELADIERLRRQMIGIPNSGNPKASAAYPSVLSEISNESLIEIANEYLEELAKHQGHAIRVTDKMPTNFQHLGLIATLFPNATIIHCKRNPLDIFVSSYCQNLNAPFCDLDALVEYYNDYQRLMKHWNRVLPIRIHTVNYENLVANPEVETRALVASTGLAWDDRCLNFNQNERAVRTPSKWQVRQPMYSSSVDRWRRFEKHLLGIASRIECDESSAVQG